MLPPLALLSDGVNFENKKVVLRDAIFNTDGSIKISEVAIAYGKLINVFLDFLIIGFTIFLVVKFMNRLVRKAQDAKDTTVVTPKDIELLSNLNDLMEEQNALLKAQKSA